MGIVTCLLLGYVCFIGNMDMGVNLFILTGRNEEIYAESNEVGGCERRGIRMCRLEIMVINTCLFIFFTI